MKKAIRVGAWSLVILAVIFNLLLMLEPSWIRWKIGQASHRITHLQYRFGIKERPSWLLTEVPTSIEYTDKETGEVYVFKVGEEYGIKVEEGQP